jgi:hypothetical protein
VACRCTRAPIRWTSSSFCAPSPKKASDILFWLRLVAQHRADDGVVEVGAFQELRLEFA